ncbi:MAG TPA: class I mannose-6-phosphate isomerase, partial [Sumerlaeia bacterium]|nr:class I mannose-6-phosphate isomerase [Sumerlaeia bacterium]
IVLDAAPGGAILHGFAPGATLDDFDRLLAEGRVVECMRRIEVRPGDVFRVAPGTVHALCRGVAILEIQEPSDSTFRIHDYGRLGDDGKPRPLHLDAARKVMRFEDAGGGPRIRPVAATASWGRHETLVDVAAYRIERITLERPTSWRVDPRSAQTLIVLEGDTSLAAGGEELRVPSGGCAILPAAVGTVRINVGPGSPVRAVLAGAGGVEMVPAR